LPGARQRVHPRGHVHPEGGDGTIADYVRGDAYPYEQVKAVADAATSRDAGRLGDLVAALAAAEPLLRYWGAVGCTVLASQAAGANPLLRGLLDDPIPSVRIAAAEALGYTGDVERAVAALAKHLDPGDDAVALEAINALDFLGEPARSVLNAIRALAKQAKEYPNASAIAGQVATELGAG